MKPWHMWGSEQVIEIPAGADRASFQLARIKYGRPETWRFLFYAQPVEVLGPQGMIALFNLTIGVGRTITQFESEDPTSLGTGEFAGFQWTAVPPPGQRYRKRWTSVVRTPPTNDLDANSFERIETIEADEINVIANVRGGLLQSCKMLVGCMFAPNVHIRPEWAVGEFRGGEDGEYE